MLTYLSRMVPGIVNKKGEVHNQIVFSLICSFRCPIVPLFHCSIAPLLFYCSIAPLFFPPVRAEIVDQVAAVVGGEVITFSDVSWLARYKGFKVPEDPNKKRDLYLTVLDQIIDQKLISREAQQTPGIQISPQEVETQLQAYRRRFSSEDEFREKLKSMEMTLDDLQDLMRRELAVWKFVQIRFEPFIIVLPQQIRQYYEERLIPELKQSGTPIPPLELVEEQIREILTLERTNQEMDRWVANARRKAQVRILLFRDPPHSPNLPRQFLKDSELQPVPIQPVKP
ncbi:MAG: SurA N-terminal domain-containing protein [Acidobacteriota bacterium]